MRDCSADFHDDEVISHYVPTALVDGVGNILRAKATCLKAISYLINGVYKFDYQLQKYQLGSPITRRMAYPKGINRSPITEIGKRSYCK